jgi:inorganic pyrophosphatase
MSDHRKFHQFRSHPWHGLEVGPNPPRSLYAFIEITPFDVMKYELDKNTGFMMVDRPQLFSSLPPTLYGFVPRTYCGKEVGKLMPGARSGDGDPLDICVLSERPIARGDILLKVHVVGGIPMLDDGQADDKIIAVLDKDALWNGVKDVSELPDLVVHRIAHYFATYKSKPGQPTEAIVGEPYGHEHAEAVVKAAILDYEREFA